MLIDDKPSFKVHINATTRKAYQMLGFIFRSGKSSQPTDMYTGAGELAAALDDFDDGVIMDPLAYNEVRSRPSLEERLESIISAAALMADAGCTRDERRERIVAECNAVRQALQDLLSEYMANMGQKDQSPGLNRAIKFVEPFVDAS